ncbi:GNAT family N-acetyltransferase [Ornithinibacillus sp. BX22]|uniref:GNAT family N-acetyltransferase n=2 Tax=Ornithinibacillus TaxID=484508 RepID=A0A923L4I4_9BACI|nr:MULTISPECIES: GNAT family N-acetyltransferase [Ornithinibacillus]MBC5636339.1 GNAT family N-acetyltransferase [Ornithinibacillus hominis]MBS3681179.1 GNAT family N-acetyltransferase [Ornithinibacillus massiliensis]
MPVYTRKATIHDLEAIMSILNDGIAYLKEQGLPQWQNGDGPTPELIKQDIEKGYAHVLISDNKIAGYGALVPGPEAPYENMTGGSWKGQEDSYIVIHRIAVDLHVRGKGLSKILLHDLIVLSRHMEYKDVRIDTYPKNEIMQKVIVNAGFHYSGMIYFPVEHGERKAYQLLLD